MDSGMEYSDEESNAVIPVISKKKRKNNEENLNNDSTFNQYKFEEDPIMKDNCRITYADARRLNPYLLSKYEFENKRKTLKPGPKSVTRYILSLNEMVQQLKDDGINPITAQPIEGSSFVDNIYIHPDLLKNFDFKYKRITKRSGPKSMTRKPLSMHEKYDQITRAGIDPTNGYYIKNYKKFDSIFVHPKLFQTFPFNRVVFKRIRRHKRLSIREMYRQIIDAGIDPLTGEQFSDEEDDGNRDDEVNMEGMEVDRDDKHDDNSDSECDDNSDSECNDNSDSECDDNSDSEYDGYDKCALYNMY